MRWKLGVAVGLILLASVAGAAETVFAQAQPIQTQSQPQLGSLDFEKLYIDALGWLQGLIRIDTTNPPGNEMAAAKYLAGILQKEGIPVETYESAPGRGILIARLSANSMPDPSRALLLLGHLDVVGVDKSKWQVDPFGAVIQNGYLYGRGAIDDKGMTIANVAVMVALKRANVRLTRDVILLAEGDEEEGGQAGIKFAMDRYWEKIAAGFSLNEGGRVMTKDGKVRYVGVQAAEKVPVDVTVTATGTSGHGSVPLPDNAIVRLSDAIAKINAYQTPYHLTPVTETYFEQLSTVSDPEIGKWMRALENPVRADLAEKKVSDASPVWNSMMRDTIAPTMLKAGIRPNVVPSEAQATLNIRLLPGNSIGGLLLKLREAVNDPKITFQADTSVGEAAPSSSLDSELFKTIQRATQEDFPGAPVVPMMSTGATDSAYLRLRNVQAYGLLPFPLTEEDTLRMHADNERIPLDSFHKGIEFLYRIVSDFTVAK
ncbi:MAG TPA: M20/M25/M40 family metallo-hydrolase [Candidatus Acidoferrales bacterium]|nr:M20/M25/M40 family metallo-hydrolase [Candidatus Acidoferrales bacterium]